MANGNGRPTWAWVAGIVVPVMLGLGVFTWRGMEKRVDAQEVILQSNLQTDAAQEARLRSLEDRWVRIEDKLDRALQR